MDDRINTFRIQDLIIWQLVYATRQETNPDITFD